MNIYIFLTMYNEHTSPCYGGSASSVEAAKPYRQPLTASHLAFRTIFCKYKTMALTSSGNLKLFCMEKFTQSFANTKPWCEQVIEIRNLPAWIIQINFSKYEIIICEKIVRLIWSFHSYENENSPKKLISAQFCLIKRNLIIGHFLMLLLIF